MLIGSVWTSVSITRPDRPSTQNVREVSESDDRQAELTGLIERRRHQDAAEQAREAAEHAAADQAERAREEAEQTGDQDPPRTGRGDSDSADAGDRDSPDGDGESDLLRSPM